MIADCNTAITEFNKPYGQVGTVQTCFRLTIGSNSEGDMQDQYLIFGLALATFALVIGALLVMRARVAARKKTPERSAFVETHGGPPRPNRPGTEH